MSEELKALKAEYEQKKEVLVEDFLNEAIVRHVLAPLEVEIARLEEKEAPKKDEAEAEEPAADAEKAEG